jgi:hypothetical protein
MLNIDIEQMLAEMTPEEHTAATRWHRAMEGHAKQNLQYYLIALQHQRVNYKKRLLLAKLKILEAREAEREKNVQTASQKRSLF